MQTRRRISTVVDGALEEDGASGPTPPRSLRFARRERACVAYPLQMTSLLVPFACVTCNPELQASIFSAHAFPVLGSIALQFAILGAVAGVLQRLK